MYMCRSGCLRETDKVLLLTDDRLELRLVYRVRRDMQNTTLVLMIRRELTDLFTSFDIDVSPQLHELRKAGLYQSKVILPHKFLKAGRYSLTIAAGRPMVGDIDRHDEALSFEIEEAVPDFATNSRAKIRSGEM